MTKKEQERQEKIDYLNKVVNEDIKILEEYIENFYNSGIEIVKKPEIIKVIDYKEIQAISNLLKRYKELEEENKTLKEYIFVAPNLDEMTAVAYKTIQEGAYIRGRAEEKQRAREIIRRDFIPISVIQNNIRSLEKEMEEAMADGYMHINYEKLRELANKKDILQELLEERNK